MEGGRPRLVFLAPALEAGVHRHLFDKGGGGDHDAAAGDTPVRRFDGRAAELAAVVDVGGGFLGESVDLEVRDCPGRAGGDSSGGLVDAVAPHVGVGDHDDAGSGAADAVGDGDGFAERAGRERGDVDGAAGGDVEWEQVRPGSLSVWAAGPPGDDYREVGHGS